MKELQESPYSPASALVGPHSTSPTPDRIADAPEEDVAKDA
jgi:hypothetical protein